MRFSVFFVFSEIRCKSRFLYIEKYHQTRACTTKNRISIYFCKLFQPQRDIFFLQIMAQQGPTVLEFLKQLNTDDKLQLDDRAVQHYARVLNEQWFNYASELQAMDSQVPFSCNLCSNSASCRRLRCWTFPG